MILRPTALLLLCLAGASWALADDGPVTLTPPAKTVSLSANGTGTVRIQVHIGDGYHIFSTAAQIGTDGGGPNATEVSIKSPQTLAIDGALTTSPPDKNYDPNFGMDVQVFKGDAWVDIPLKADAKLKPGTYPVVIVFNYQACNDSNCLPPQDVEAGFDVVVPAR